MTKKLDAFERLGEATGDAVANLSRRRFVLALGAFASAAMAGIPAIVARGRPLNQCTDVQWAQIRGPARFSARVCVPAGTCNPPNAAAVSAAELETCKTLVGSQCANAVCPNWQDHCRHYKVGSRPAALPVATATDLGRLGCPVGQTTCLIEFGLAGGATPDYITCGCECV